MALFLFLVDLWQRFGIALNLDPFYFSAIEAIRFVPQEQIVNTLRAFGHTATGNECGITFMTDWGDFRRTVPAVWIAEPSATCPLSQLAYFLGHELMHALVWIRDGLTVWPGH